MTHSISDCIGHIISQRDMRKLTELSYGNTWNPKLEKEKIRVISNNVEVLWKVLAKVARSDAYGDLMRSSNQDANDFLPLMVECAKRFNNVTNSVFRCDRQQRGMPQRFIVFLQLFKICAFYPGHLQAISSYFTKHQPETLQYGRRFDNSLTYNMSKWEEEMELVHNGVMYLAREQTRLDEEREKKKSSSSEDPSPSS